MQSTAGNGPGGPRAGLGRRIYRKQRAGPNYDRARPDLTKELVNILLRKSDFTKELVNISLMKSDFTKKLVKNGPGWSEIRTGRARNIANTTGRAGRTSERAGPGQKSYQYNGPGRKSQARSQLYCLPYHFKFIGKDIGETRYSHAALLI